MQKYQIYYFGVSFVLEVPEATGYWPLRYMAAARISELRGDSVVCMGDISVTFA